MEKFCKIDDQRRIIMPRSQMDQFNWLPGDKLHMILLENGIVLSAPRCSLCDRESQKLLQVRKGGICSSCLADAQNQSNG